MELLVILEIILVALAVLAAMLSYRYMWVKPNMKASFLKNSDTICEAKSKNVDLTLYIENVGLSTWRRALCLFTRKRMTAHDVVTQIFLHKDFEVFGIENLEGKRTKSNQVFRKPGGGPYVFIPDSFGRTPPVMISIDHGEKVFCSLKIKTPQADGKYEVTFDITSRQGALSCNPLFIYVMTNSVNNTH